MGERRHESESTFSNDSKGHGRVGLLLGAARAIFAAMATWKNRIEGNLRNIRDTIASVCLRCGRQSREVSLVAVTKSAPLEAIKAAVEAGLTALGESRVQQLTERAEQVTAWLQEKGNQGQPPKVCWHMVGHLQRNKVKAILDSVEVIHSVDSLRLAEEISTRAERCGRTIDVLVQVNCSQEPQKSGCAVGAAMHLAELVCSLSNLHLIGLMAMGPLAGGPEAARPAFARMRELFEEMRHEKIGGADFRHLSMGMSQDYPVAIEEGATILRIGSALFE
jgi:hypothetical protein